MDEVKKVEQDLFGCVSPACKQVQRTIKKCPVGIAPRRTMFMPGRYFALGEKFLTGMDIVIDGATQI